MALVKAHAFAHEAVEVGGVHPACTERVYGVVALLIGHDEDDVGPPRQGGALPGCRVLAGLGGGEGTDAGFVPDATIADGEVIAGDGWRVEAIWTPGHHNTHLAFDVDTGDGFGTVLCGDHVMGWSTSIVSPPDGDLTQFMESCDRLLSRPAGIFLPGHRPGLTPRNPVVI